MLVREVSWCDFRLYEVGKFGVWFDEPGDIRTARDDPPAKISRLTQRGVSQIGGLFAEIGIFKATEQNHQVLDRFVERSLHIHPLFAVTVTDRIPQLRVAHEEDLRFKNFRPPVSQIPPDARLNFQQLPLGRRDDVVESLDFL